MQVKDVRDHRLEDRMESFFLAETAKYLYLLFDPDNFLHENGSSGEIRHTPGGVCILGAGGYVFNTEAHPMDLAAIHCCSAEKRDEDRMLQEMEDNIDLLAMLGLTDDDGQHDETDGFWEEFKDVSSKQEERRLQELKLRERALRHGREKYLSRPEENSCGQGGADDCNKEEKDIETDKDDDEEEDEDDFLEFDEDFDEIVAEEEEDEDTKKEETLPHRAHLVDMTQFTEMERNFTRAFMEELQLINLLKNMSADLATKMRDSFKETEYEHMAKTVAKKLDAVSLTDEGYTASTNQSSGDIETSQSDKLGYREGSEQATEKIPSDLIIEGVNDGDSDDDIHDKIEQGKRDLEAREKSKPQQEELKVVVLQVSTDPKLPEKTAQSKVSGSPAPPAPTEESESSESSGRFKQHITEQLQKEDEQQKVGETTALDHSSLKSPSPLDKRTNLLALTTKILQMFSSDSDSSKDSTDKNKSPSLAGLYSALSNYSLNYFHDPWIMHCPSRPYHHRLSIYGEMFPDDQV